MPSASSSSFAFESSSACASRARTPWTCAEKLNNKLLQPDKRSINVHHDEALKAAPNSGHILKYLGISHHFPLGIHVSTKQREWHQEEQEPTQEKRYPWVVGCWLQPVTSVIIKNTKKNTNPNSKKNQHWGGQNHQQKENTTYIGGFAVLFFDGMSKERKIQKDKVQSVKECEKNKKIQEYKVHFWK